MSDDGLWAVVVIGLLGNPFSPSYAQARRRDANASPLDHCAMNVCLYGPSQSWWALRERPVAANTRDCAALTIGRSTMSWREGALFVDIDERTSPLSRPLRGRIVLHPESEPAGRFDLDSLGAHTWWPVIPHGRVEVDLDVPAVRFRGTGYHDANAGDVPLDASFAGWTWSRARLGSTRSVICYDVTSSDGQRAACALDIDSSGNVRSVDGLGWATLRKTVWGVERQARTDRGATVDLVRTLEDTPFYARSLVRSRLCGTSGVAVHEALSLTRVRQRWVQFLLGFRMAKAQQ